MEFDFCFHNPTKIYFGKSALENLKEELKHYGKTIMLAYGKGAIKKIGLYDELIKIFKDANKNVVEFSGIMPNPTAAKVKEGIKLVRENNVDFILAVGGGSTMDCVKAVSMGSANDVDFWDYFYMNYNIPKKKIPFGTIVTMVGTGSEMNGGSVITNEDVKIKTGVVYPNMLPDFSILNPEYTYSLSEFQMVSGICDMMSHIMEQYFSESNEDNVSDDLSEALMKNIIKNAYICVKNPKDYNARGNIMWAATLALNTLISCSKKGDWEVHNIEHQISAYYDVTHGMGLAAISPSYYRHILDYGLSKFKKFAINVFDVNPEGKTDKEIALEGIDKLEEFFKNIGATTKLSELGVTNAEELEKIAETCFVSNGAYKVMTKEDIKTILINAI
ncbi:TPA: iron-containing alcohol dehydrogenase [Candidatus Galligastranaerophilus gallistercoris]|nr:iron-containing alcohol dehydrogenase [Candidatus Galligastranaerophilus gallistercoris]